MGYLAVHVNFDLPLVIRCVGIGEVIPFTGIQAGFVIVNVQEPTAGTVCPNFDAVCGIHAVAEPDVSAATAHTGAKNNSVCARQSVEIHPGGLCDFVFDVKSCVIFNCDKIAGCAKFEGFPKFAINPFCAAVEFTFKAVF